MEIINATDGYKLGHNRMYPEGLDGKYTAIDQVPIEEEKDGYLETVFEDGILKKEYSLEEIRQRIDNGL